MDNEETGTDLELNEESCERACWFDSGNYWLDQYTTAMSDDEDGTHFSAGPYGGALAREGGLSDRMLLLSGFEARANDPELTDNHELTSMYNTSCAMRSTMGTWRAAHPIH